MHLGLVFGLVAAAVLWIIMRRTRWGYEVAVMGENIEAARYAGMRTRRTIVVARLRPFFVSSRLRSSRRLT